MNPQGGAHLLMAGSYLSYPAWRGCILSRVRYLKKLFSQKPLDFIVCSDGFIFLMKEKSESGQAVIRFYFYNQLKNKFFRISEKEYLKIKFGPFFEKIAADFGNYVTCKSVFLPDGNIAVMSSRGLLKVYSPEGDVFSSALLTYQGSYLKCLISFDKKLWCTVPEKNCVVAYCPYEERVMLRIGGGHSGTFNNPNSLEILGNTLFVTSKDDGKVRKVNLNTLTVSDHLTFEQPAHAFFISGIAEYVILESGLYRL